jgi:peptidoglycan/LPS O-acetylase OafA/YrhL
MTALETKTESPREPFEGSAHRLECLDSIRGLAALAVVFCHVTSFSFIWPQSWIKWTKYPLIEMPFDGKGAVAMFFVLGGFVLARPYISGPPRLNLPAFYIRRFIRIWFPWFCAFVVTLVFRVFLFRNYGTHPEQNLILWRDPIELKDILLQCVFCLYRLGGHLMPQDWSLGIELIGSALIPVFVVIARKQWHFVWLTALAILFVTFVPQAALNPGGGGFYVSFILGVLLAKHQSTLVARLRQLGHPARVLIFLAGLSAYEAQRIADHFGYNGLNMAALVWVIMSVGSSLIILTTLSSRRISYCLTVKPVLWIGKVSYSIYLLQMIVLLCLLPAVIAALNKFGIGPSFWMLPLCLLVAFAATVVLAAPFYRFVELPSIAFGHYVSARFKNKVRQPVPLQPTATN